GCRLLRRLFGRRPDLRPRRFQTQTALGLRVRGCVDARPASELGDAHGPHPDLSAGGRSRRRRHHAGLDREDRAHSHRPRAGAGTECVPVIRDVAARTPFSARAIRALGVLEWIVAIGAVLYFATMTIGTNEVAFDLGIVKAVGPGITTMQAFVVLGIIGGAEL